jgi:hypothetical protein
VEHGVGLGWSSRRSEHRFDRLKVGFERLKGCLERLWECLKTL